MLNMLTGISLITMRKEKGLPGVHGCIPSISLVPPEIYFKDHPEYYALRDGKRLPTQLCLSNPEVVKVVIQNLRREIAQNPAAKYWSVSQNDNRQYCMCDECRALDEKEGSHSGTMMNFVNQVAEQFPDYMISTLAYEYTQESAGHNKTAEECKYNAVQH